MKLYYKDKLVEKIREYVFVNTLRAEILVEGLVLNVDRSELKEYPSESIKDEVKIDQNDENEDDKTLVLPTENDDKLIVSEDKQETNQVKNDLPSITAIKVSNSKETDIGAFGSDEFNVFIKSNKLNVDAVSAILEGKQKSHKGFTFK